VLDPWRIRTSAPADVLVTVELVDRAPPPGCDPPWAHWRADDIAANPYDPFNFWLDRTGNGRHATSPFELSNRWPRFDPSTGLQGLPAADFRSFNDFLTPAELNADLPDDYTFSAGITFVQVMTDVTITGNWEFVSFLLRPAGAAGEFYFYLEETTEDGQRIVTPLSTLVDQQGPPRNSLFVAHDLASHTMAVIQRWDPAGGLTVDINGTVYNDQPQYPPLAPFTIDQAMVGGSGRALVLDTIVFDGDASGVWDFGDGVCETLDAYLSRRYGTIVPGPVLGNPDPDAPPEAPVLVLWKPTTDSEIFLAWRPVSNATLYELEVTPFQQATQIIERDPAAGTTFTFSGLPSQTTFTFRARGLSGGVWTGWSEPLTVTTL
jgi:hypothetical protein